MSINKEKITIAMIGCGRFAQYFVELFKAHPYVEKVYVCDLIRARAEKYSQHFDVEIIDSFEEALASKEINAIAIFTQRFKHGPMAIEALKAGKHVYSSVPCSLKVEEIAEIKRLVEETHLTYSMGETGFYRAASCFCRREYAKGSFGRFAYGESQYNHDIRNMEGSFRSSGGDDWKKFAGIPPFFYPTHTTSMLLSSMPGVYAKKVTAMGFANSERTDIYGTDGQNLYNNPFSNESMLIELSNGGIIRVNENRCVAWHGPETFISQFYGSEGCYDFSFARATFTHWQGGEEHPNAVIAKDVTKEIQPEELYNAINENYEDAIARIAQCWGFYNTSPIQPTERLPKEYEGLRNGHNGTHHFLIDDFCRAYWTGKLSPTNIWEVARWNIPGLIAHESALAGGQPMEVIDLGDSPADWEVLPWDKAE